MYVVKRSINRNIVECKEKIGDLMKQKTKIVLIETLWNVKMAKGGTAIFPNSY